MWIRRTATHCVISQTKGEPNDDCHLLGTETADLIVGRELKPGECVEIVCTEVVDGCNE